MECLLSNKVRKYLLGNITFSDHCGRVQKNNLSLSRDVIIYYVYVAIDEDNWKYISQRHPYWEADNVDLFSTKRIREEMLGVNSTDPTHYWEMFIKMFHSLAEAYIVSLNVVLQGKIQYCCMFVKVKTKGILCWSFLRKIKGSNTEMIKLGNPDRPTFQEIFLLSNIISFLGVSRTPIIC